MSSTLDIIKKFPVPPCHMPGHLFNLGVNTSTLERPNLVSPLLSGTPLTAFEPSSEFDIPSILKRYSKLTKTFDT